jgi:predicted metal-binding protein
MKDMRYICAVTTMLLFLAASISAAEEKNSSSCKILIDNASMVAPNPERENLNMEWIEILNAGDADCSMEGWTLSDQQNHTYTFGNFTIKAGATALIHSGSGNDTASDLYFNRKVPLWNNEGDVATLKDASGNVVARYPEEIKGK